MNWDAITGIIAGAAAVCGGIVWLVRLEGQLKVLNLCKDENKKNIDLLFEMKRQSDAELKKDFNEIKNTMVSIQLNLQKIVTHLQLED